jgi:hypothetical protein
VRAVLGGAEQAAGAVQVTDDRAAFRGVRPRDVVVDVLAAAARARSTVVPWGV